MIETVSPNPASDAKLAYSQGVAVSGQTRTLYISGQISADGRDFEEQTRQV